MVFIPAVTAIGRRKKKIVARPHNYAWKFEIHLVRNNEYEVLPATIAIMLATFGERRSFCHMKFPRAMDSKIVIGGLNNLKLPVYINISPSCKLSHYI